MFKRIFIIEAIKNKICSQCADIHVCSFCCQIKIGISILELKHVFNHCQVNVLMSKKECITEYITKNIKNPDVVVIQVMCLLFMKEDK